MKLLRGIVCLCLLASVAEAGSKMLKGPYLQDLAPSSITVMWQMDELVPAKLVVEGPGGERTQTVAPARIVEARIENLQPATRYRYRVEVGDDVWKGEFATAPETGKDVPF
ncbi:MAG TPA: fibronectin type III domain-containing protein, partial [Kofleriaceae bacterium]|nr:fibronectin type III domain-containing protein [Kofleriaceae bacterium]